MKTVLLAKIDGKRAQIADGVEDKGGGGRRLVHKTAKRRKEHVNFILPILCARWICRFTILDCTQRILAPLSISHTQQHSLPLQTKIIRIWGLLLFDGPRLKYDCLKIQTQAT
jgi:hypothetical protein